MPHNWRTAFHAQAKSDYKIFKHLMRQPGVELCHCLHYLQMATEKFSKGSLVKGNKQPPTIHNAFVQFLQTSRRNTELQRICRIKMKSQFIQYIDGLLDIACEIEKLAPKADSQNPNPEYPWCLDTPTGSNVNQVNVPAEYTFPNLTLKSPKMIKLTEFLESCFKFI